jgi:MATE family multidrug resistance protein
MDSRPKSSRPWIPSFLKGTKKDDFRTPPNERTALLPSSQLDDTYGESYELDDEDGTKYQLILREFWILFRGSIPVVLAYALQNSLQTISVLIVGRLSPEALATAAFSYMFAMATGWLIALGGTTAIDTLASASFTGSKNPHDLGIILQRSFVVLSVFYVPVAILWFCSEPIFKALGQEDYIARDSARFLSVLAPGGLGYIYFEAVKKYLQAQGQLYSPYCLFSR